MRIETVYAADAALFARGRENREIGGQHLARCRGVVQVAGDSAEQQRLSTDAGETEALRQFLVLRTPADEVFVEAIDADQVVAPGAEVAGLDRHEAVGEPAHRAGQERRVK